MYSFIYNIADTYTKYDIVSKIKIITDEALTFPAIYICINKKSKMLPFDCQFNSKDVSSILHQISYIGQTCLVINDGKNSTGHSVDLLTSNEVGKTNGMTIKLFLDIELLDSGYVAAYIGDNKVLPKIDELEKLYLEKGKLNDIIISKLENKNLPYPYNNCMDNLNTENSFDSDFYRASFKNGYKYRRANCYDVCACAVVSVICNCTCDGVYETGHKSKCYEQNNCFEKSSNPFDYKKHCQSCPLECDSVSYKSSPQTLDFVPTDEDKLKYQRTLEANNYQYKPVNFINLKGMSINIFYDEIMYTEITESPKMTVSDLISSIGGCLGLFLGISLLSFIEIFEFLIEILYLIRARTRIVD